MQTARPSHADRDHAKWNSSGAYRWTVCVDQPNFAEKFPEPPPSQDALDGTKAHELLQLCLENDAPPHRYTNSPEFIRSIDVVLDYLAELRRDFPDLTLETERRVWFPQDVVPETDCGGTLDIFCFSPSTGRAWLIDFKHGAGVVVEAEGNKQLLSYATARLWRENFSKATLVIIQPRAFHAHGPVRTWDVDVVDLMEFATEIDAVLREATGPAPRRVAGPHCKWCPCAPGCGTRDKHALNAMQQDFHHVAAIETWQPPEPLVIPLDKLVLIHKHADQIKEWVDAASRYLFTACVQGEIAPEQYGLKLVETQARRKWIEDQEKVASEVIALSGHTLSLDDVRPRQLATITDLTAALTKIAADGAAPGWKRQASAAVRERLAHLTTRETSGNLSLVDASDTRPSTSRLAQQFGAIAGVIEPVPMPTTMAFGAMAAPIVDPETLIHKD